MLALNLRILEHLHISLFPTARPALMSSTNLPLLLVVHLVAPVNGVESIVWQVNKDAIIDLELV